MSFDVARVRGLYPTLGSGIAHLEGGFSALLPESVIRAIITTLRSSPAQPGSKSARSMRSAGSLRDARRAVADLVNARPDDVMIGSNVSTLLGRFVDLAAFDWQLGDEIVLSRLDQNAYSRQWLRSARAAGAIVQWAEVDVETAELPDWQYEKLINRRTRVITVPLANPATGQVPATARIAELAHSVGALVVADAGTALPHMPIDLLELGVDAITIATNTFGGPTLGVLALRAGLMEELDRPGRLRPQEAFEVGSIPVEMIDGLTAAVDHLAGLDEWALGDRRERLVASLTAAGEYQRAVFDAAITRLQRLRGVTLLGSNRVGDPGRIPVGGFTVAGSSPSQVGEFLYDYDVSVWTGENGMSELMRLIGADEIGGMVHFGVMPHSAAHEVDQFIDALSLLTR